MVIGLKEQQGISSLTVLSPRSTQRNVREKNKEAEKEEEEEEEREEEKTEKEKDKKLFQLSIQEKQRV